MLVNKFGSLCLYSDISIRGKCYWKRTRLILGGANISANIGQLIEHITTDDVFHLNHITLNMDRLLKALSCSYTIAIVQNIVPACLLVWLHILKVFYSYFHFLSFLHFLLHVILHCMYTFVNFGTKFRSTNLTKQIDYSRLCSFGPS